MLGRIDDLKVVSCRRHVSNLERVAHPARLGLVLGDLVPETRMVLEQFMNNSN